MNILLIDTSTRTARVGLIQDEQLTDITEWESTPELGKKLLEVVDELLKKHGLKLEEVERVAVHRGRVGSSFMSLRTGIVTATMLAQALGAELVAVESDDVQTMIREVSQGEVVGIIQPVYS